jgi:hypothetical protein
VLFVGVHAPRRFGQAFEIRPQGFEAAREVGESRV